MKRLSYICEEQFYDAVNTLEPFCRQVLNAKHTLLKRNGPGKEFLGWLDLPKNYPKDPEFQKILSVAKKIQQNSDVLVVIGIGGSYLGARAGIEFVNPKHQKTKVIFAGNNLSNDQMQDQFDYLKNVDFSVNVISKSGTTTEPAIAFRFFKNLLERKYGKSDAAKRIFATTDAQKGALRTLAEKEGYETFVVPNDVGGRFSVLTAVGLLPMAVAGLNIDKIMTGAYDRSCDSRDMLTYAVYRHYQYAQGKLIEIFANFDPALHYVGEWIKQLFAESEGKNNKGIVPYTVDYTTDLHSVGQMIQEGARIFFETIPHSDTNMSNRNSLLIPHDNDDLDCLNYLDGKTIDYVNFSALNATIEAHRSGGVPCSEILFEKRDEYSLGQLFYFFEYACSISGYMLKVNPFNQPGVEAYKTNMFKLMGKPGYEKKS